MKHIELYNRNIAELDRLFSIHSALKDKPEFRRSLQLLNKSEIVLLVACWEAFIEELAVSSFDFLLSKSSDHKAFPAKVLAQASKVFWNSKDERGVWELAGDGWKSVLTSHRSNILREYLGNFNTPRPTQIDKLFESLIGLSHISSHWRYKNMSNDKAKQKLEELISIRGSIAHKVLASKPVTKKFFLESSRLVVRLGVISSNTARNFLYTRVGEYPWGKIVVDQDGI